MDLDGARRQRRGGVAAGQCVGAPAADLDRRERRRHLLDRAPEAAENGLDFGCRRPRIADGGDRAFGVVCIAGLAPAHGEAVGLAAVHQVGDGLGRFAERHRQHAGG